MVENKKDNNQSTNQKKENEPYRINGRFAKKEGAKPSAPISVPQHNLSPKPKKEIYKIDGKFVSKERYEAYITSKNEVKPLPINKKEETPTIKPIKPIEPKPIEPKPKKQVYKIGGRFVSKEKYEEFLASQNKVEGSVEKESKQDVKEEIQPVEEIKEEPKQEIPQNVVATKEIRGKKVIYRIDGKFVSKKKYLEAKGIISTEDVKEEKPIEIKPKKKKQIYRLNGKFVSKEEYEAAMGIVSTPEEKAEEINASEEVKETKVEEPVQEIKAEQTKEEIVEEPVQEIKAEQAKQELVEEESIDLETSDFDEDDQDEEVKGEHSSYINEGIEEKEGPNEDFINYLINREPSRGSEKKLVSLSESKEPDEFIIPESPFMRRIHGYEVEPNESISRISDKK